MKHLLHFSILGILFLWSSSLIAQCPPPSPSGAYVFDTQAEVDDLLATYPNCTELSGFVNIAHEAGTTDPITNLNGFINITSLENLTIKETTSLTDLTGLNNLTQLLGSLSVNDNIALESMNGLDNLTGIGVNSPFAILDIYNNTALTDISALQNVNSGFIQWVLIVDNPLLSSLEGMDNMIFDPTMFDFQITGNPNLSVCAVEKICEYITSGGAATINGNAPGCSSIGEVTTTCQINFPSCPETDVLLTTQAEVDQFLVDYPFCAIIPGTLTINDAGIDPIVNLDGLQNIQTVYGLTVQNTTLTDFSGLGALESIAGNVLIDNISADNLSFLSGFDALGGSLVIQNNAALTSLTALDSLTHLNGSLEIVNNDLLTTLAGLDHIVANTITNLIIENNAVLTSCNMEAICIYLVNGWPATIAGNDTGCDSVAAVQAICNLPECPPGNVEFHSQAELDYFILQYPNCTELNGVVIVNGVFSHDITNLNAFQNITHIESSLAIEHTQITDFEGLNNLTTIGGGISSFENNELVNFNGLENLGEIGGSLTVVQCDSFESFDGLQGVTNINRSLRLQNCPSITNFEGLNSLTQIGVPNSQTYQFEIWRNDNLVSLDGLENLTSVYVDITIQENPVLSDLSGLIGLTRVGTGLGFQNGFRIQELPSLQSLDGLDNLSAVYGNFRIYNNPSLSSLAALNSLTVVEHLSIRNNDELVTLNGLQGITKIGLENQLAFGDLDINDNDGLISLEGLNNLEVVNGVLYINRNENLVSLNGLNNLETIGWTMEIGLNPSLVNVDALNSLTSLGVFTNLISALAIGENDSLTSLEGLINLTQFIPNKLALYIENNPVLTTLSGLDNIPIGAFYHVSLQWNGALSICSIPSICGYIATNPEPNHFRVSENISGCNTALEVEAACEILGVEEINLGNSISLHPNPMQETLSISTTDGVSIENIDLFDVTGKLIISTSGEEQQLNVANLSKGIYFISIETDRGLYQQKLIK